MRHAQKPRGSHLAILAAIIFVVVIEVAFGGLWHGVPRRLNESAKRADRADLEQQSRHRNDWPTGRWPPPDTPIHINSAFGRYTVPLQNLGGRDEFLLKPLTPMGLAVPLQDGSYNWSSFSVSFWMPDGAGVLTEAAELLTYQYVDPADLAWHRAPMRPREARRPDPSATRYVVVVGEFCPRAGPPPGPRFQGATLTLGGYGYGAVSMYGCAADKPDAEWMSVDTNGPGRTEIFCHAGEGVCFGWIDLASDGVRALTYLPRDAVDQTPAIAARMHALLQQWKDPQ